MGKGRGMGGGYSGLGRGEGRRKELYLCNLGAAVASYRRQPRAINSEAETPEHPQLALLVRVTVWEAGRP